jgi:TPR repeat protein
MTPDEIARTLAGSPEERTRLIKSGAEAGVAEAQAVLGQMLLDGAGVPKDAAAALTWFKKAAAQGHVMGINMVGRCYDLGWGVRPDKGVAAQCYRMAAEQGLDWAMYNYATLLALGEGVAEDKPAALDWLRKAAQRGNAKAINFVGSFHEDGWVVERDLREAARYFAMAAEGGDFRGAFNHARMLAEAGDIDGALQWLGRSAETATPAFIDKAVAWLNASADRVLQTRGVAVMQDHAAHQ